MKRTNALQRMLEDLTATYNDNQTVDVEFTSDTPHASTDYGEPYVAVAPNVSSAYGINASGPNELRVIVDTLSHEVAHVRWTPLDGKREFSKRYPEAPKLAGTMQNLLEDLRIDAKRKREKRGLRKAHAFKIKKLMENDSRRPPMDSTRLDNKAGRVVEALTQAAFAGDVKNVDALPDDERELVEWARQWFDYARKPDTTYAEVEDMAHMLTQRILALLPDRHDALDEAADDIDIISQGNPADEGQPIDKDDFDTHPHYDRSEDRPDYYNPDEAGQDDADDAAEGDAQEPDAADAADADGGGGGDGGGDGGGGGDGDGDGDGPASVDTSGLLDGHPPGECEVRL